MRLHEDWLRQEQDLNMFKLFTKYIYIFGISASFFMSVYIIDYYARKSADIQHNKEKELNTQKDELDQREVDLNSGNQKLENQKKIWE